MSPLILSVFPGIDLLGRAFEEEWPEACVVRGPDLLWGGDVRTFYPPAGESKERRAIAPGVTATTDHDGRREVDNEAVTPCYEPGGAAGPCGGAAGNGVLSGGRDEDEGCQVERAYDGGGVSGVPWAAVASRPKWLSGRLAGLPGLPGRLREPVLVRAGKRPEQGWCRMKGWPWLVRGGDFCRPLLHQKAADQIATVRFEQKLWKEALVHVL